MKEKERRPQPQPSQAPAQSDPVDARDLARRLERYAIELQLRGRSSPPPRRKPPPDTSSTASPDSNSLLRGAGPTGYDHKLLRPDASATGVPARGLQFGEAQHASTIIITQQRGPARPNSFNPHFASSSVDHSRPQSARRDSQIYANKSLPKLPDQAQVLPLRAESLTDTWRNPTTTQEAAAALALLAQEKDQLQLKQSGKGLRRLDMTSHNKPSRNKPEPASANSETRGRRADSAHQRDFSDPTRSPPLSASSPLGSPFSLSSSPRENVVQARGSNKDLSLREAGDVEKLPAATKSDRAKPPTGLKIHVRKASQSNEPEYGEARSIPEATNRISANTINLIMADVPHTPALPAFPSPPSLTIPANILAGSRPQVATPGQNAFMAAILAQEEKTTTEESNWSRQVKLMADQLDLSSHQRDLNGVKTSAKSDIATSDDLPPTETAEQSPTKGEETKRGRELRMRNDAVKQAGAPHLNGVTKGSTGESARRGDGSSASDALPMPQSRSASRSRTRQRSVSIKTPRVPQILRKSTKSPGSSQPGSRHGSRPSSRARSRANSDGTRGHGIIASIKPQPLPQKDAPTPLQRQKSLPLLSAIQSQSQSQQQQGDPEDKGAPSLAPVPLLQRSSTLR